MQQPALLVLEDGTVFKGISIGCELTSVELPPSSAIGEVVFNTAMTGYQEILTDPSYARQIVTLTYPHIGNTGVNPEDFESNGVHAAGLVIKDMPRRMSNWRSSGTLTSFLADQGVPAIAEVDTRRLTRHLRQHGAQSGCIVSAESPVQEIVALAKNFPGLAGLDLASEVTCETSYRWTSGCWDLTEGQLDFDAGVPVGNQHLHVVAMDFGVKRNILRMLCQRGCEVTVVPASTRFDEIMKLSPDGVFLSNGPGDPEPCDYAIDTIRQLIERRIPIFGICLGHQLLALASGARTEKMKFGHHGANHPVQDLRTDGVMITSQNHGFAVDPSSLGARLRATHKSLFDGTLQGIERTDAPAFGFQGHPEASPGPHDMSSLFDQFIDLMRDDPDQITQGSDCSSDQTTSG